MVTEVIAPTTETPHTPRTPHTPHTPHPPNMLLASGSSSSSGPECEMSFDAPKLIETLDTAIWSPNLEGMYLPHVANGYYDFY